MRNKYSCIYESLYRYIQVEKKTPTFSQLAGTKRERKSFQSFSQLEHFQKRKAPAY